MVSDHARYVECYACGAENEVPASDAERAAYERGLRRGMAIARRHEWERARTVDWTAAEAQMEREIEEAKR